MKFIALLLLSIVVIQGSMYREEEKFLKNLLSKDYGKTILDTIQLELGQDNAVNRIISLLRQMLADIQAENSRAQGAINERETTCKQKIAEIDAYTERTLRLKADLERQVPLKQEELQDKQKQMEQKGEELQRNKARLENFVQIREQEHKEFMDRREEMTQLINGLRNARSAIQKLNTNVFLEVKSNILSEIQEHHKTIVNLFPGKHAYKTISALLLELASDQIIHSDQNTVQVIIDIIDELVESIYEVQKQEIFADDQRTRYFSEDLQRLQIENNRLETLNLRDQQVADHLNARYQDIQTNIGTQELVLENKAVERADWMGTCQEENDGYRLSLDLRNEQTGVVEQLITLMETSFDRVVTVLSEIMA